MGLGDADEIDFGFEQTTEDFEIIQDEDIYEPRRSESDHFLCLTALLVRAQPLTVWHPLLGDQVATNPKRIRVNRSHELQEIEIKIRMISLVPVKYDC